MATSPRLDAQIEMDHAAGQVAPEIATTVRQFTSSRSQLQLGSAPPEEFPRRLRIPVTIDTLSTYSIMRGNHGQDIRPLYDPLHSALYPTRMRDFHRDDRVILTQATKGKSMNDFDSLPRGTNLHWDPLITPDPNLLQSFPPPRKDNSRNILDVNTNGKHCPKVNEYREEHPIEPSGNHYTGDEVYANFGYITVNGKWVDPDSEGEIHKAQYEVTEGHNSKAELPRLDKSKKGPMVMSVKEYNKFWEKEEDGEERGHRGFGITPATFARWAEGAKRGDEFESKVMKPSEKLPPQTEEEAFQAVPYVPKRRAPQFDVETWSQMSGEYDVPVNPTLIHDSHGYLNIDRAPNSFSYSSPQSALNFYRRAFLPVEDGSAKINSSLATASTPELFTNERAFHEFIKKYDDKKAGSVAFHEKEDEIFDLRDAIEEANRNNAGLFRQIHGVKDQEDSEEKGRLQLANELLVSTIRLRSILTAAQDEQERIQAILAIQQQQQEQKKQQPKQNGYQQDINAAIFQQAEIQQQQQQANIYQQNMQHGGYEQPSYTQQSPIWQGMHGRPQNHGEPQEEAAPYNQATQQAAPEPILYTQQDETQNEEMGHSVEKGRYAQEVQHPGQAYSFENKEYDEGAPGHPPAQKYYQGELPLRGDQSSFEGRHLDGSYNEGEDEGEDEGIADALVSDQDSQVENDDSWLPYGGDQLEDIVGGPEEEQNLKISRASQYSFGGHPFDGIYHETKEEKITERLDGHQTSFANRIRLGGHQFDGIPRKPQEEKDADHSIEGDHVSKTQDEAKGNEVQLDGNQVQQVANVDEEPYISDDSQQGLEFKKDSSTSTLYSMQVYDQNLNPVSDSDTFPTPPDHNKRVRRSKKVSNFNLFSEIECEELRGFVFSDREAKQEGNGDNDPKFLEHQEESLEHERDEHVRGDGQGEQEIRTHKNAARYSTKAVVFETGPSSLSNSTEAPCHPFRFPLLGRLCLKANKSGNNEPESVHNGRRPQGSPLPAPQPRRISNLIQHMRNISSSSCPFVHPLLPALYIPPPLPPIAHSPGTYIPPETTPRSSASLNQRPSNSPRKKQYGRYFREETALQRIAKAQAARREAYMNEDMAEIMAEFENLSQLHAELSAAVDKVIDDNNQGRFMISQSGFRAGSTPLQGGIISPTGVFQGQGPFSRMMSPNAFQGGPSPLHEGIISPNRAFQGQDLFPGVMSPNAFPGGPMTPGPTVPNQMVGGHMIPGGFQTPSRFQSPEFMPSQMGGYMGPGQFQGVMMTPNGFQASAPMVYGQFHGAMMTPNRLHTPGPIVSQIVGGHIISTGFQTPHGFHPGHATPRPMYSNQMIGGHMVQGPPGQADQHQAGFMTPSPFQNPRPINPNPHVERDTVYSQAQGGFMAQNHRQTTPLNSPPPMEQIQEPLSDPRNTTPFQENQMAYRPIPQPQMVGGHMIPIQGSPMTYTPTLQPQIVTRPYFPFQTPTLQFHAAPLLTPPHLATLNHPRRARRGRITPEHFSGPLREDQLPESRILSGSSGTPSRYGIGGRWLGAALVGPRPMLSTHFEGGTTTEGGSDGASREPRTAVI